MASSVKIDNNNLSKENSNKNDIVEEQKNE